MRAGEGRLTVAYPPGVRATLARLAEAHPGREVCGLVLRHRDGRLEVVPLENAAPEAEAGAAFAVHPVALLRAVRAAEAAGASLAALYHSHPGGSPALSRADREGALAGGAPLWPGAEQVVIAVRGGRAELRRYRFTEGDFEEVPLD